jgi:hypothetical protein
MVEGNPRTIHFDGSHLSIVFQNHQLAKHMLSLIKHIIGYTVLLLPNQEVSNY